jgi:thiamine pyrophosphokinase
LFKKWYEKETIISLIPVGQVNGITTDNLVYPLNEESLILGQRTGSSNSVLNDGIVTISYKEGDLLMMECHD